MSFAATLGIEWFEYSTDGLFGLLSRSRIGKVEITPRSLAWGEQSKQPMHKHGQLYRAKIVSIDGRTEYGEWFDTEKERITSVATRSGRSSSFIRV